MTASVAAGLSGDSGWILTAATLVVAGLLLVPGWIVGRAAHLAALPSLAVAPALGSAIIAAAEILAHTLALSWLPWGWAVIASLTAVLALMARLIVGAPPEHARRAASPGRAEWAILAAGLSVAVALPAGVILSVLPSPGYPAQAFDATFHLNAVAAIREGGNASMLGGLSALYSGRAVYYPTVWHGAVALAPGGPAPVSTAGVLALTAVVWPLSLLGLLARATGLDATRASETERVHRRQRTCAVAAVLAFSAAVVGFPLLPMTALAVWPYALSVAGLPGVLVLYDLLRQETASWRLRLTLVLLTLAAAGGVVAAHGTGLFNLAVLSPPFLVNLIVSRWRRCAAGRGGRALLVAGAVASVLVLVVGAWVMRASLASVLGYQRPAGGVGGIVATLGQALIDLPMYGAVPGASVPVGIVFGGLTLGAAWSARAQRDQRPWLVMWLLSLLLVVLVGGPQWAGRQLGAPWYLQKARILPLVILPALVLMAQAGAGRPGRRLWGLLRRLASRVGGARPQRAAVAMLAALVLLPVAARVPLERNLVASVYDPQRIKYGTLLTEDALALIARSRSVLPQDAVVLGAPSRGAAHLWSVGGVHVVYPTRDQTAPGTPGATLPSAWPTLGQKGSRTCALLNQLGVHYFYSSSDATAAGSVAGAAPLRWDAPLTRIPSEGLELIDSQGGTSLWRITACD
ncbi:hypothetical protein BKH17_08835 [Actinomyces oris]|uniref:DUF6541 family protein n=1 Tax=Actinomyces TaxID=1654 RepID=UPI000949C6EC|nr:MULTISPECIES: DUF6541 family protein [Actinomyces]OLL11831.1 hypothetical protein BKH17_08835 [Actinomyces oris]QLF54061.1 hypothetical protein HW274_09910 [Actinomyces sp. oral taxon 169]